jgi:hypothetical protein
MEETVIEVIEHPLRVIADGKGPYKHTFGGDRVVRGLPSKDGKPLVHLLYDLDLSDPVLGFLEMDCVRLPLLYPFSYDGADLAYRVKSEGEVELLAPLKGKPSPGWPYPNYPRVFKPVPVSLDPIPYEVHKTLAFAYEVTSDMEYAERLSPEDRKLLDKLGHPFTQIGGILNLPWGAPDVQCPNAACRYHTMGAMDYLATVREAPIPGVSLWGEWGISVIIVYQICSECRSIYVSNTCD